MAGRIREDDIALVRERARIDEVVEQHVTLRNAGGGSRKGLCPFHDEKSPSFNVTPSRGMYYCFGCGAGGDVFSFLQEIEGLSFTEAVERLAGRYGVQLRYAEGSARPSRDHSLRARLLEANEAAAQFYADRLAGSDEAVVGRRFLADRGFDRDAAQRFGVGFAPRGGESLLRHLRGKGFDDETLVTAGLVVQGSRGPYDRFRGRLVWPIRDVAGDVVGFGARRMFDDDRVEAKYLNTPETPVYDKRQVLYGVDLARKEISRASQAVVVEGYTDVMACHEAGVATAVATCGTAFGQDHARVLRRLLLDHDAFRGEVIFTFDGDEAGQKAAMRAFQGDEQFVAQTYVAVEPNGTDPCDLRLANGDAAVRELVASRVPLYRFVLGNVVADFDLDRADQRVDAVRKAAGLVAAVRDRSKVDAFAREIASMVGVEVDEVRAQVREASRTRRARPSAPRTAVDRSSNGEPQQTREAGATSDAPSLGDPRFADEREALKAIVQHPHVAADALGELGENDFTHPTTVQVWQAITQAPLPRSQDPGWVASVRDRLEDEAARHALTRMSVEPLLSEGEPNTDLVAALVARLQELTTLRRIDEVKSRLQRTNPVDELTAYNKMFGELVALEQQRRALRERAIGGSIY